MTPCEKVLRYLKEQNGATRVEITRDVFGPTGQPGSSQHTASVEETISALDTLETGGKVYCGPKITFDNGMFVEEEWIFVTR